jgi:cbb3-type cytochrome oxidase subunit 1
LTGGKEMEMKNKIGVRLIMIASIYMVVALFLGLVMGMSGNHALTTVHSHMSLLGWTTMAITGFVYMLRPRCANTPLSSIHFWLNNIGLPIMILGLVLSYGYGNSEAEKIAGIGSIIVLLSLLVFAINMVKNLRND